MRLLKKVLVRLRLRFLSKRSTGDEVNPYNYPLF